ncbi:MAG: HEAT repeat domain-containing protein [Elainellaceae cyanobacterium]
MAKTLTIQLPRSLEAQFSTLASATDASLEAFILQTLQLISTSIQSLHSASPEARAKAAAALGLLGTDIVVPALATSLQDDSDPNVRQAAAEALHQIGTDTAIAPNRATINELETPHFLDC